jgi:peptidoglycan/LPS O-acetylase OafA/YrhL
MSGPRGLLAHLSRISSSGRFIPEIDGLRFIAITAVVLHHVATFIVMKTGIVPSHDRLYMVVNQGFFGVQLFFVISGFILALPFAESRLQGAPGVPLGRYFGRRLTRLEPPYAINLLLLFAWLVLRNGRSFSDLWPSLLASLTYVHAPVFSHGSYINLVAWSLEIEVQFYLLAPLLCSVFALRKTAVRRTVLVGVMLLASVANEAFPSKPGFIHRSLPGHIQYFLLGLLLADWYLLEGARGLSRSSRWDLLGLLCWCGIGVGLIKVATPRTLLLPLILIAYMSAFRGRLTNAVLGLPLLTTIGGMCYTIYLYHNFLIHEIGGWTWRLQRPDDPFWRAFLVQGALLSVAVLAICTVLFAFLERPFMRPRWWKRA